MLEFLRSPSRSAAGAILYVTIGTLMVIWAGLWYYYFILPVENPSTWQRFTCVGTILSGLAIVAIGLLFGLIGRGAREADNKIEVAPTVPVAPLPPPGRVGAARVVEAPVVPLRSS